MSLALVKPLRHLSEVAEKPDEILAEAFDFGLLRGMLNELNGHSSCGKTSLATAFLAKLTSLGEICGMVDVANSFDPVSAYKSGVVFENLLWVRCHNNLEHAFSAADYLVQAKNFGMIWLNLSGVSEKALRAIPTSYWYRFKQAVRGAPTVFIVTGNSNSLSGSAPDKCYSLTRENAKWSGEGRFKLFREFTINGKNAKKIDYESINSKIEMDYEDV